MTEWLDCPTCAAILQSRRCAACNSTLDVGNPGEYTVTDFGIDHFLGPFCSAECRERANGPDPEALG